MNVDLCAAVPKVPEGRGHRHPRVVLSPLEPLGLDDIDIDGSGRILAAIGIVDHEGLEDAPPGGASTLMCSSGARTPSGPQKCVRCSGSIMQREDELPRSSEDAVKVSSPCSDV